MKKFVSTLFSILLFISCEITPEEKNKDRTSNEDIILSVDTIPEVAFWADSLIMIYIEKNQYRLKEVDGIPISYIKDIDIRNNRTYGVARIGHSFEHRYVTDQWIFIDSISKDIYEYDLVNDSLIPWK